MDQMTKRQVGGILVIVGGSSAFYHGLTNLIYYIYHFWGGGVSAFDTLFWIYIAPLLYLILGTLVIIAGIRISFAESSGVTLALIGGISLFILGLTWEICYLLFYYYGSIVGEDVYSIIQFIIIYVLLRDCLIIGGALLSYRANVREKMIDD